MSLPLPLPPPLPPPVPAPSSTRVMSAADFVRPNEPSQAQWVRAVTQLAAEGVTLASERAAGGHAAGYFDKVMERAKRIMATKPLPLPPPRPLPLPPRPLPLPPGA